MDTLNIFSLLSSPNAEADDKPEVCSKCVYSSTSSSVEQFKLIIHNVLIKCVSKDPKNNHDKQFQRSNFANHSPKTNKHGSNTIWSSSEILLVDNNIKSVAITMKDSMPKSLKQNIELNNNSIQKECIWESTPCIIFDESHKESKTD